MSRGAGRAPRIVTVHGGDYEHTLDLHAEDARVEVRYRSGAVVDIFRTMATDAAFEVAEMSLASYLMLRDRGDDRMQAIPVFPFRAFRQGAVFVREESTLVDLSELSGLRMAVSDYGMTAAVWLRGILADHHGVDWRTVEWHAETERIPLPPGSTVRALDESAQAALMSGRVDAALLTTAPRPGDAGAGGPRLRRLLRASEALERSYLAATGIYPIMHLVVLRRDLVADEPAVPTLVFDAYARAKRSAYQRRVSRALHPWGGRAWELVDELFEGDPLPYGRTSANMAVLRCFSEYLLEQGLVARQPDVEAWFEPSTSDVTG